MPSFPPHLRLVPTAAAQGKQRDESRTGSARFFRNRPDFPQHRDEPPPDDRRPGEPHNPLSEREQRAYLILAGLGCLPFLLLLLLVILTHSPLMAN